MLNVQKFLHETQDIHSLTKEFDIKVKLYDDCDTAILNYSQF